MLWKGEPMADLIVFLLGVVVGSASVMAVVCLVSGE